ncbi:MAG: caspase family protein [Pseudomonadota bacterium]
MTRAGSRWSAPLLGLRAVALCLATVVLLLSPLAALASNRVALVIGNGGYETVPSLVNPLNDAEDISSALEELGFQVFTETDASKGAMEAAIAAFSAAAEGAEAALFYYAGHAFQVGGTNYLIPTDLSLGSAEEIVSGTVDLGSVFAALDKANGVRLIFLDACRDNPLGVAAPDGVQSGLAEIGSSADYFISFATQPGAVAFDGDGRNGTFTESVLSHIHTPAQSLTDLMISVRRDVISASGGQQVPWENSSLTRQFTFAEGLPAATPETLLYQVAARTQDPNLMALYIQRYPEGAHSRDVASQLQNLGGPPTLAGRSLAVAESEGDQLWLLAQRTRIKSLAEYYLELYPDGRHAPSARAMVSRLPEELDLGDGRLCEELATHPRDATANVAGVPFSRLQRQANRAIEICTSAMETFPEQPKFAALLARAKAAGGLREEAITLYREAAGRGDLRALVSLGLLMETGDGLPRDPLGALELYEVAADAGSADGAINLAVALFNGRLVEADPARAVALFEQAADTGSAVASYNLGVLAQDGALGDARTAEALGHFRRAAQTGEPRGYVAAAIILDEGRGSPPDPGRAADMLLRGAASDSGGAIAQLTQNADAWSRATIVAVQERLAAAGHYAGAIDGISGPGLAEALRLWRNGGFVSRVLGS